MSLSRRLFGIFIYLGLLVGAVLFVKETVEEFIKSATSYTEEQKAVTLHDLPTIVVCLDFERNDTAYDVYMSPNLSLFPMTYGTDVVINVTVIEKGNKTVTLLKNQGVKTLFGLNIFLDELKMIQKWTCYKISTKLNEEIDVDINDFRMQLVFAFPTAIDSFWGKGNSSLSETGKILVLSSSLPKCSVGDKERFNAKNLSSLTC